MILTEEQRATFEAAARPLIQWMNEHCHPHVYAIVSPADAELVEGVAKVIVHDFIQD